MTHSIVIVDDHILIAKGITAIIDGFSKFDVLYEVANGKALIEKLGQPSNIPDIVLLDISMPLMDGYETAAWLRKNHPEILILALTQEASEYALIKMIRSGASGYIVKTVLPAIFEEALSMLVKDRLYLPEGISDKREMVIKIGSTKLDLFNEREIELFPLLALELTYAQIAKRMHPAENGKILTTRAVEAIRDSLFHKTKLKSRVGLVIYGIKNGFIKI